jgi:hypothetical protein
LAAVRPPLISLAFVLLTASCGPSPAETGPVASANSTSVASGASSNSEPSTQASETPPASADRVATVLVDDLRVRESPGLGGVVIGLLSAGDQVFVTDRRAEVDGLTWVYVQTATVPDKEGALGFVAEGDESGPFLEAAQVACPSLPVDVLAIQGMAPWGPVMCFGSQPLDLTVWDSPENYGFGGLCNCVAEPGWLIHPFAFAAVSSSDTLHGPDFFVRLAPRVDRWPMPTSSQMIVLTGHFDDPASSTCEFSTPDPELQPGVEPTFEDKASIVLRCREQFVVSDFSLVSAP